MKTQTKYFIAACLLFFVSGLTCTCGAESKRIDPDSNVGIEFSKIDDEAVASDYLIVDVSGGPAASSYPVEYTNTAPDLTGAGNVTYKGDKIVLKWISSGNFMMGSPGGETGRSSNETQHNVTHTRGFYIGVFEVTQQQYDNVIASKAVQFYVAGNPTYPANNISWEDIRGTEGGGQDWPNNGHAVAAGTFMGNLLAKTGLGFDLPTEAQWEYACRAGTTGALNNGKVNLDNTITDADLNNLGWYSNNASGMMHEVGGKTPNAWGLYDCHGNMYEWCLDWSGAYVQRQLKSVINDN